MDNFIPLKAKKLLIKFEIKKKSALDATRYRGFDGSVRGEINLLYVLLEEQTWSQNHAFTNFNLRTLQHYCKARFIE